MMASSAYTFIFSGEEMVGWRMNSMKKDSENYWE